MGFREPSLQSRQHFLSGLMGLLASPLIASDNSPKETISLKKKFNSQTLIGVALPNNFLDTFSEQEMKLLETHFNSITPENCMKWPNMVRESSKYDFSQSDEMIRYAKDHSMSFVGHTLIFNRKNCYPKWLFENLNSKNPAHVVWSRIESHIGTLIGRYRGSIDSWDVLNEFVEVHEPGYRETSLTKVLGPDYPIRLFKLIEQIDPKVKLTYNDFAVEQPERRKSILKFIKKLKDAGCKIDVIGSQSHLELKDSVGENLDQTIREFASLGVKCAFTELDVDVIPRNKYWNMSTREEAIKNNPYAEACPDEILEQQANVYRDVFQAILANSKWVDRVTLWGLTDKYSWLNNWPWKRTNHGLLFDRKAHPKPALHKILSLS